MKSLLILPHIKVEGANAISGIVYGFPAITQFLGFVHAISRELNNRLKINLGGCGIISHGFQLHTHKISGAGKDHIFSLTRNPLLKDGSTASFNEEGRIHMEVSIIIECDFTISDFDLGTGDDQQDQIKFKELVYELVSSKRMAGGIITSMAQVEYEQIPQVEENADKLFKKVLKKLLPGFVLCDQSKVFAKHLDSNPSKNSLEAILDFYTLKSKAGSLLSEDSKVEWQQIPKPAIGWFVPVQVGYKAISPLYKGGEVACSRDQITPFCFVEPIYGLAEWIGLHRVGDIRSIFWSYQRENDLYLCLNKNSN